MEVISRRVGKQQAHVFTFRGESLNVLQELGGWESPLTVRRYSHFATDYLAAYVNNAGIVGTN